MTIKRPYPSLAPFLDLHMSIAFIGRAMIAAKMMRDTIVGKSITQLDDMSPKADLFLPVKPKAADSKIVSRLFRWAHDNLKMSSFLDGIHGHCSRRMAHLGKMVGSRIRTMAH